MRSLRGDMSQEQAMDKLGMNQNAISRLENPYYGKATLTTLKRIAAAYDVGLLVEFVPFSRLVDHVSGTPSTDPGLSPLTMNVPSFEEELQRGDLEATQDNTSALRELRLYSEWTPAGSSDVQQSVIEQEVPNVPTFVAPSASGALDTLSQKVPSPFYQLDLNEPKIPMRRIWKSEKCLRNYGRRFNKRQFLSRKRTSLRGNHAY